MTAFFPLPLDGLTQGADELLESRFLRHGEEDGEGNERKFPESSAAEADRLFRDAIQHLVEALSEGRRLGIGIDDQS